MDPITLSLQAIGFGMQLFGGLGQAATAKQMSAVSSDKAMREGKINDLKYQQSVLESQRMQMQNIRNIQRARALATASATNQGANLGTGLQGGLADVQNQGAFNMLGVNQAASIGAGIFGQNQAITQDNQQLANLQGKSATDQGIATLGGAILKSAPTFGQLSQGFGGSSKGGNYQGMPWSSNTGGLY